MITDFNKAAAKSAREFIQNAISSNADMRLQDIIRNNQKAEQIRKMEQESKLKRFNFLQTK